MRARQVQRLHRSAFRQSVSFVRGQSGCARRLDRRRADRRAADGDETKRVAGRVLDRAPAGFVDSAMRMPPGAPRAQHLRQDDEALRLVGPHRSLELRRIELRRPFEARVACRDHDARRAGQQRCVESGDVFEQHAERQRAQVARDREHRRRARHAIGRNEHRHGGKTDAFGRAGRTRGERDLRRAAMDRRSPLGCARAQHDRLARDFALLPGPVGERRGRCERVDAGRVEDECRLLRGEESGDGHVHDSCAQRGEVEDRPCRTVVEPRRDDARSAFAEHRGDAGHLGQQRAIADRTVAAHECPCRGLVSGEAREESLDLNRTALCARWPALRAHALGSCRASAATPGPSAPASTTGAWS